MLYLNLFISQSIYGSLTCKNEPKVKCIKGQNYFDRGCKCDQGWMGAQCGVTMDECSSVYCNQQGNCSIDIDLFGYTKVECICQEGFFGANCDEIECVPDCGLNGICEGGQCRCFEGWTGNSCNKTSPLLMESFMMENLIAEQGKYLK